MSDISEVIEHFKALKNPTSYAPYGSGHINQTFLIEKDEKYILQKINTFAFKNPDELMANIAAVTKHLGDKIAACGGDPKRETLTVIPTDDGKPYYRAEDGSCYRVYIYIDNAVSHDKVENAEQFYNAARAFGRFQNLLADFPADTLYEVIEKFHDTRDRFRQLTDAISENHSGRLGEVAREVDFALSRKNDCGVILDAIAAGEVPTRVTHNDTKLNNILLDPKTHEGVCVIDLDTVMPGSLLYDFGDALRYGANSAAEDEQDLDRIHFRLDYFEAFVRGFVEEIGGTMTKKEIELLPFSVKLLTLECGIRFLTDYLNGDTYFRIHREKQNLDRCRAHFRLVQDIEAKMEEMRNIVNKYI